MRDAVQQGQCALHVDLDDVVVELHAGVDIGLDVRALLVGIERLHLSTLRAHPDRILS